MSEKNKTIFISIANFNIKIIYQSTDDFLQKGRLQYGVNTLLKGFFCKPFHSADFTIKIEKLGEFTDIQALQDKNHYILFYQKLSKRKVRTFYDISNFQFQVLIQNILYELISESEGFMLHASAVSYRKNAYLFCGRSGAGKSTSVQLLKNAYKAISDDFIIIRKIGSQFLAFQHPFAEKNLLGDKTHKNFLLKKIYFIYKSPVFKESRISTDEATKLLVQQLISPNRSTMKNILVFASNFDGFSKLFFAKDKDEMIKFFKTISS